MCDLELSSKKRKDDKPNVKTEKLESSLKYLRNFKTCFWDAVGWSLHSRIWTSRSTTFYAKQNFCRVNFFAFPFLSLSLELKSILRAPNLFVLAFYFLLNMSTWKEDFQAKKRNTRLLNILKLSTMIYGIIIVISADLLHEFMNSLCDLVRRINLRQNLLPTLAIFRSREATGKSLQRINKKLYR